MANDLKVQIILKAVDKALKPIRKITQGSDKLSKQLKRNMQVLKQLNQSQNNISAFRRQSQQLKATEQQFQQAQQKVKLLAEAMRQTRSPTRSQIRDFERAQRAASQLKTQYGEERQKLQQLRKTLNDAGIHTRSLGDHERRLRNDINRTNNAITSQKNRLKQLGQQQKKMSSYQNRYRRNQRFAGTMAANGAGSLATGSSYLYAGTRLLQPGIDFGEAMSRVQALSQLDGNSAQLKALRGQARQLGATTQFTAVDAANAQGFLAMAGFNPKAIQQTMPSMLNLAQAGHMDLGTTADISSNILSGFSLPAKQMTNVADILTKVSVTSNTNLQMLGDTLKYMAPVANTAGMSLEQAASMAGLLGNVGIQASQAGTTLRSMLLRLSAPTGGASKMMKKLGISATDANGRVRAIPSVLQDVAKATQKMGNGQRLSILKTIFGEEPAAGMAELIHQAGVGGLKKYIDQVSHYQGTAAQVSQVMTNNLSGDIKTLVSSWQDLGIEIETQQDGPLRQTVQRVTDIVRSIKSWINANPRLAGMLFNLAAILTTVMVVGGALTLTLASLLGPLFTLRFMANMVGLHFGTFGRVLGRLAGSVLPLLGKTFIWLGRLMLTNPIGLAITAIGVAAYLIYRYWEPIKKFFGNLWDNVKATFHGGLGSILKAILNFSPLGLFYKAFAGVMSYFGVDLPKNFTGFAGMLIDGFINGLGLGKLKDKITEMGSKVVGWFKAKLGIHSPSRVFAQLGAYTLQGYNQGLQRQTNLPLKTLRHFANQLRQQGQLELSGGLSTTLDTRAPLRPRASRSVTQQNHFEVNIHAAPGMDSQAIGREVQRQLALFQQQLAAQSRSRLNDEE
ncbi:phage tail tape measure protein [Celerinatantimonas sp. YJH-8]|uniref:phage tail tape measure protein n=1 Tax=Celerinatantimonas sp. YJH-8 TaxID=3228714 RepID=UPI0038CB2211